MLIVAEVHRSAQLEAGGQQAHKGSQGKRLACTGLAHYPDSFAGLRRQRDRADGRRSRA
jgi:hypothetical protein